MDVDTSDQGSDNVADNSAQDTSPVTEGTTPEPSQDDSQPTLPAEDTAAESGTNEPQTDPNKTDGDTIPEKGINPDEGIDPAAPDKPLEDDTTNSVDLKNMSRAERAEYFQGIQKQQQKQVEQAIDRAYSPQPVDELTQGFIDEGYDQFQAQILARETVRDQQAQINAAKAEIAELNSGLATEAMEVISTIPWLNSANKAEYDGDSTEAATQLYETLAVSTDPRTGQIIEAKMTPKEFYGLIDKIVTNRSQKAAVQSQKNAERQLAAVAPPTSTSKQREPSFEDLSPDQMREQLIAKGHVF